MRKSDFNSGGMEKVILITFITYERHVRWSETLWDIMYLLWFQCPLQYADWTIVIVMFIGIKMILRESSLRDDKLWAFCLYWQHCHYHRRGLVIWDRVILRQDELNWVFYLFLSCVPLPFSLPCCDATWRSSLEFQCYIPGFTRLETHKPNKLPVLQQQVKKRLRRYSFL